MTTKLLYSKSCSGFLSDAVSVSVAAAMQLTMNVNVFDVIKDRNDWPTPGVLGTYCGVCGTAWPVAFEIVSNSR